MVYTFMVTVESADDDIEEDIHDEILSNLESVARDLGLVSIEVLAEEEPD